MNFLDNIALPQSHEHLILLKYLLGLTFTLFLPYLAILIGSTFVAIYLKWQQKKDGNEVQLKMAKDLINLVTLNKSIVFALGIIPLISAIFCYVQLLQNSGADVSLYLSIAFLFFIIGVILLFSFKNSFNLSRIFDYLDKKGNFEDEKEALETFKEYKSKSVKQFEKTGIWSLVFLLLTALMIISSLELAANSAIWSSEYTLLQTIFSVNTLSYFLYFIAVSITITSAVILFYFYKLKRDISRESELFEYSRKFALTAGIFSILVQPILIAINLIFAPEGSLSSLAFIVILVSLIAMLITASLFYLMLKEKETNFVTPILIFSIAMFVFININDQLSFATTSKEQLASLEKKFLEHREEFEASLGLSVSDVSGADIFNGKCIACHRFDRDLTGPAYNSVLPKYEGNQEELANFILNPVKINPDYPAMPNQGLKPNEAKAVAEYLLSTYKEESGGTASEQQNMQAEKSSGNEDTKTKSN